MAEGTLTTNARDDHFPRGEFRKIGCFVQEDQEVFLATTAVSRVLIEDEDLTVEQILELVMHHMRLETERLVRARIRSLRAGGV